MSAITTNSRIVSAQVSWTDNQIGSIEGLYVPKHGTFGYSASKAGLPKLGQVNGALGQTIGNLLDGKKTAIGIAGALLTSLLTQASSGSGALANVLTQLASGVPGLSGYAMPIFLALSAWGALGKLEKWAQGTAPPLQPSK